MGSNYLQGTSVPVMAQFAQNYFAGKLRLKTEFKAQIALKKSIFVLVIYWRTGERFQAYDYGWRGNLMRYRSFKPMEYILAKVTAPVF